MLPSDTILENISDKIFIISLPRTGTKSLTKMLMILGYEAYHCPSIRFEQKLLENKIDVFADTPIYCPSLFNKLKYKNKFIYIDRDFDSWLESFERTKLHNSYLDYRTRNPNSPMKVGNLDRYCLSEIFMNADHWDHNLARMAFDFHRIEVDKLPSENLLIYNFNHAWSSLCSFLDKKLPDIEVPHINKNTLFEKIV